MSTLKGKSNRESEFDATPSGSSSGNRIVLPTVSSSDLFGTGNEIFIEHEDLLYRLRITKQGKLILNK